MARYSWRVILINAGGATESVRGRTYLNIGLKGNVLKSLCIFLLMALYSCVTFAAPENNPDPSDRIEVIGTIPDDVEAVLVEDWYEHILRPAHDAIRFVINEVGTQHPELRSLNR